MDRKGRLDDDIFVPDRKTIDEVFDKSTLDVLYDLMAHDHIAYVDYPISTGKEAKVFRALAPDDTPLAVKIMRLSTSVFKEYRKYIEGDYRFKKVGKGRRLIYMWTKKEYSNLKRMHKASIKVPEPITFSKNVLVMRLIEDQGVAAPMLKDVKLSSHDLSYIYEEILKDYKSMVNDVQLIHGDLSEYNILLSQGVPYLIDVSQSVPTSHPMADELFMRDVNNIERYFKKCGIETSEDIIMETIMGGDDEHA
ncbi:MAG: serine protein kinase RIO [Thermoplasmata archaeon]